MSLTRARDIVRMGQYAYPASCLAIAALVWQRQLGGTTIVLSVAVVLTGVMWLLLRTSARWLNDASVEQSELGNQLIQSQRVLALGELSTGIAHEINNPLNIIMQEAELMRFNLASNPSPQEMEEIRGSLDVIYAQVMRCSDITHKLLDFARHRKTVSQLADINRLVEDMLELVERETSPKNIRIIRLFDDLLPLVKTDPPLLRQVFLNLLINAVQAVHADGDIIITTYASGEMACTEIRDTGPGIPSELRERIFNPFFTTKSPGEGTGLGLSVSLRIVNELGGNIAVNSSPGEGAAFTVCIPVKS